MSDTEETPVVEVPVDEPVTDLDSAIKKALKFSLAADGLRRGLHECCKAIDGGDAQLVFLAESCDHPEYKKLVEALADERQVPLLEVPSNKTLGEYAGLWKFDAEGNPKKQNKASCVVIVDSGEDNAGWNFIASHLAKN